MFKKIDNRHMSIGDRLIELDTNIDDIVDYEGLVVVLLRADAVLKRLELDDKERNILAFDQKGDLLWKVSKPPIRPYDVQVYTSLFTMEGRLFGGNTVGYDYEIDPASGSVKTYPPYPNRPW